MTQSRHACALLLPGTRVALLAMLLMPSALAGAAAAAWSPRAETSSPRAESMSAGLADGASAPEAREHLPRMLSRDLPLIDRVLGLDSAQRPIVEALLADVEAGVEAGVDADAGARAALAAFRENLTAVLSDGQRARLGEVWAAVYRERMESAGTIGGEGIDLAALARGVMRGEPSEGVESAVARYRSELDPLLDARAAAAEAAPLLRVRLEIRSLNERAVDMFATALPAGLAGEFRREAARKSFPTALAPSAALGALDLVLVELPVEPLRALRVEAAERYEALCSRGVAAVRARDEARGAGEQAGAAAARQIEEAEREYDAFETWLNGRIVASATPDALGATRAGRAVLETAKQLGQGSDHRWTDRSATVQRFDSNGDGAVQGDEATSALEAFARSVGRQQRRRL